MVLLNFAIVGEAGSAFLMEVDKNDSVALLTKKINRVNKDIMCPEQELQLFLAKRKDSFEEMGWLDGPGAAALVSDDLQHFTPMDPTLKIGNDKYFGSNFHSGEGQVHVLVRAPRESVAVLEHLGVHHDMTRDEALPLAKRVKIEEVRVAYQGPVPEEFYSVPMETIETYLKLEVALSREMASLCLLYGPRQFGKTTIAHRLTAWLKADPSVLVIYASLIPRMVETEESFWLALGKLVGEKTKSSDEFETMFLRRKTRLWLAIDEMDTMLTNEKLSINFLDFLRMWQSSKYFLGFLGIGSRDLLKIPIEVKTCIPFNLAEVFQVHPFTTDQMCAFFQQIAEKYPFRASTRQGIMEYSSGVPGVFGSLVRYSIDYEQFNVERHEWEDWFKFKSFSHYIRTYNSTYGTIREDLQELSQSDWDLLGLLLKDDATGSSTESGINQDTLLRMGIVTTDAHGTAKLMFSSEMMRRLCLEAFPLRDIRVVATADDPLELFAVSLQFVNPESIRHAHVKNKLSPSESAFQFELYASIRGIFKANNISIEKVLAEARYPYVKDKRRLDIIVTNGVKYGYELKSDQLTETEITAAVEQVDDYRELLGITTMFMVNFVPRSHSLQPPLYSVKGYPDVKIIHVFFPDTCDEYTLEYERTDGVMESRTVRCT